MVRSQFSELFAQSADIFAALKTVLARGEIKEIDPAEVVRAYLSVHPDTPLSDATLLEQVVQAAADAGVAIKVSSQRDQRSVMNKRPTTIERAFELAKSGRYVSAQEIRKVLATEGYQAHQLVGRSLHEQLKELMRAARDARRK